MVRYHFLVSPSIIQLDIVRYLLQISRKNVEVSNSMNELNAMQWLNKVDDALDWVLGPPARETPPQLTEDGDDNNSIEEKKNNHRADHSDAVRSSPAAVNSATSKSGAVIKSPVIIHEDYTCPSTPMASAAVGEFLVLDESPYPTLLLQKILQQQCNKMIQ